MKTIAIASGKGGAGKTTLSALLALRAADTVKTVLADADVEASNLPLALDAQESTCVAFQGGATASIDPVACTECGNCESACRFDAISVCETPSGTQRYEVDPWACEGCGRCVLSCSPGAITMDRERAGGVCLGVWDGGSIAWGALAPGEDLSGKLVTEVRKTASASAAEAAADIVLIDGPPGVGCPTIAALADTDLLVAVTEPTVSGAHDLARLLDLADAFSIASVVVLNKADLSSEGRDRIEALCAERGVDLVAEVPFDESLASTLETMSAEGPSASGLRDAARSPVADALWDAVHSRLSCA